MYIVLDLFNPLIVNVACDDDGNTKYFDTKEIAKEEAKEYQDGIVVKI